MKKLVCLIILLSQLLVGAANAQTFVVKRIEIEGLQRISPATAESYLPIRPGETLGPKQSAAIVKALYKTGFFERITLLRSNGTLVIRVLERPTIGQLKISGNYLIPTDKLTSVMRSLDIAEGHVYNEAMIDKIKQSLLNQYYQLGHYNARIDVTAIPTTRDRVFVKINISEGVVAKIRGISIIGNHAFDEHVLVNELSGTFTTPGFFTMLTQKDRYSEERLQEGLEKLRNFYLDRGYVHFAVKSAQAQVTPDRKSVYITIVIDEGELYTIKGYDLSGQFVVPKEELQKKVKLMPSSVFSRQKIIDSEKAITDALGDKGYLYSMITLQPQVDDKAKTVFLGFDIQPGKRTYVRHISFSDNTRTNDVVLRREIEQFEAAPVSTSKIEQSKFRLNRLPWIKDVQLGIDRVPGTDDQVDLNYKVKEESAAQASFKVGYSQLEHVIIGAGLNQKNFLGTGKTLGLDFNRSKYMQFYGIEYSDPYFTPEGISESFNLSISKTDPGNVNVSNGFTSNQFDAGVLYGIPVGTEPSVFSNFQIGFDYQNILIKTVVGKVSNQVQQFINAHGRRFQELDVKLGFTRDSRDKAIFPTKGTINTIFLDTYVPLSKQSLSFYTLNYHGKTYQPLSDKFIIMARGDLGYGNGFNGINDFPFFKNYYAGGSDSVRGYQGYTLGPRDSRDNPFGGNMLVEGSLGLIFPNYISDSLRTAVFFDVGNVYSSLNNLSWGAGPMRYSAGIEADFLSPFGPIELSFAKALNLRKGTSQHHGDWSEPVQFSVSSSF